MENTYTHKKGRSRSPKEDSPAAQQSASESLLLPQNKTATKRAEIVEENPI